mmetsp:Transcript_26217/g.55044  ORF Transcript_26217/g.55044 Transcript_26217/m.55044 type:complete len:329 (+) Transcript_26217:2-988(+)
MGAAGQAVVAGLSAEAEAVLSTSSKLHRLSPWWSNQTTLSARHPDDAFMQKMQRKTPLWTLSYARVLFIDADFQLFIPLAHTWAGVRAAELRSRLARIWALSASSSSLAALSVYGPPALVNRCFNGGFLLLYPNLTIVSHLQSAARFVFNKVRNSAAPNSRFKNAVVADILASDRDTQTSHQAVSGYIPTPCGGFDQKALNTAFLGDWIVISPKLWRVYIPQRSSARTKASVLRQVKKEEPFKFDAYHMYLSVNMPPRYSKGTLCDSARHAQPKGADHSVQDKARSLSDPIAHTFFRNLEQITAPAREVCLALPWSGKQLRSKCNPQA